MINLEVKTKVSVEEARNRLKSFFGEGGLGMEITEDNESCVNFEGTGGFVHTNLCIENGKTRIDLKSREWEIQVEQFAKEIG